jgi:hypothetical protein
MDLETIAFENMDENLKKEIEKDLSNFKLELDDNEISIHRYLGSEKNIVLNCGKIISFEYPLCSKNQKILTKTAKTNPGINIQFWYNNKTYLIYSSI